MLEIKDIKRKEMSPICRLHIEQQIESEYYSEWYEFYLTEDDMKAGREKIEKMNKRADGSWIPNIDYMEFTEEVVTFEEAKGDMTVAQFEVLYGVEVEALI